MTLLPDDARVYATWRDLVAARDVRGVQVHDAKLAAAMLVHQIPTSSRSMSPTSPAIPDSKQPTPRSCNFHPIHPTARWSILLAIARGDPP